MKTYLFVVYGPSADSEQDREVGMALMAEWYRSLGPALVDPGAPFTGARTASDEGVGDAIGSNATGYNMVQAESLEAATMLAGLCPVLKHGREVTVFESLSMLRINLPVARTASRRSRRGGA
jgi:hypothetical protein